MNQKTITVKLNNGDTIKVRNTINMEAMINVVNSTVEAVFDDDTLEYNPEFLDCVFKGLAVGAYTDINIGGMEISEMYDFVNSTNFQPIFDAINMDQFYDMYRSVESKINYEIKLLPTKAMEVVDELFGAFVERVSEKLNGLDVDKLENIIKKMQGGE